ncbi:MAG: SPOR domain-containing protein, partial [Arenimonas sp.]
METPVKQRLIGALVLALLAILFLPLLLTNDVKAPDVSEVPLDMPKAPESEFETHDLPLNVPAGKTPVGGVLGVPRPLATPPVIDPPVTSNTDVSSVKMPEDTTTIKTLEPVKPVETKTPETKPVVIEKPAEVKPAAVAAGNFTITVGSFTNLESANALVSRLKAQNLPVLTEKIMVNGKQALKIRVGPYVDRAAAEAARLKVDQIAGGASKVNVQDAPAASSTATSKPTTTATASPTKTPSTNSSGFAVQLEAL